MAAVLSGGFLSFLPNVAILLGLWNAAKSPNETDSGHDQAVCFYRLA